jgi:hypothetical protein
VQLSLSQLGTAADGLVRVAFSGDRHRRDALKMHFLQIPKFTLHFFMPISQLDRSNIAN